MRRYKPPYNGGRYLLNLSTGEIHDLDFETPQCNIDAISPENIYNCDDYLEIQVEAGMHGIVFANGCHYCNRSKDTG